MERPLLEKSLDFSVRLVRYCEWLDRENHDRVLAHQLLRSGTSIGANIREGNYAASRADFIAKMQIALKEASETEYWFLILEKTGKLPEEYCRLQADCDELKRMLVSTLNTMKNKSEHSEGK